MSAWPQVREELRRLETLEPRVLLGYTSPDADPEPQPPFTIRLAANALPIAEELRARFGDDVRLRVGALPFPPGPVEPWERPSLSEAIAPDHTLNGIQVELDGPLEVMSGESASHGLLVTNETAAEIVVNTNGRLTAHIVDLRSGRHVGGSAGFQTQPLVQFRIAPGSTTRIPLVVGTVSYVAEIGYVIPPGPWGITVDLNLANGEKLRSPMLAFDVIAE
jgi:hypothetical protein